MAASLRREASTEVNRKDGILWRDWAGLSPNLIEQIFSRLTFLQRWRGPMFVCKSWKLACVDPTLNSIVDIGKYNDSFDSHIQYPPKQLKTMDSMLQLAIHWSKGSLSQLRVRACTDLSLMTVASSCPNLQVLVLDGCFTITDCSMMKIGLNCSQIRELDLSYCFKISSSSLELIGVYCQNLKIFKRNTVNLRAFRHKRLPIPAVYQDLPPQEGDREALIIGKSMAKLEHLEIKNSNLTGAGFECIYRGCSDLKFMDLKGCSNLTVADLDRALPMLTKLEMEASLFRSSSRYFEGNQEPSSSWAGRGRVLAWR